MDPLKLKASAYTLFTPSAPVDNRDLFSGRQLQLLDLTSVVLMPGRHAILYGERGVGKTSLANILRGAVEATASAGLDLRVAKVSCDSADTRETVLRKLLRQIEVPGKTIHAAGFLQDQPRTSSIGVDQLIHGDHSPEDLRYLVQRLGLKLVLIVDEFDRLDGEQRQRFADAVKVLSDNDARVTLILVGVADNVSDVLASHGSVERALAQIRVPRMTLRELQAILPGRFERIGIPSNDEIFEAVAHLSQGLPHFCHLLGLGLALSAIDRGASLLEESDATSAVEYAVHNSDRSLSVAYSDAVSSPRKDALFAKVLSACALTPGDAQGFFRANEVLPAMKRIHGEKASVSAIVGHLDRFCDAKHGSIMEKRGQERRFQYRFRNPALKVYSIIKAVEAHHTTMSAVKYVPDQRTFL